MEHVVELRPPLEQVVEQLLARRAQVLADPVDELGVADLVLRAFGHALGQGTMNNLTLGNDRFTYYETLGGGQGACADADGPSGVHVAMSNTRNTPVEALELEFPMRVGQYAIRRGSGGDGAHFLAEAGEVRGENARGDAKGHGAASLQCAHGAVEIL